MKSFTLKLLSAVVSLSAAAHVLPVTAASDPRLEVNGPTAESQRRAARRKTARRAARPAATSPVNAKAPQPAKGGTKEDAASPRPGEQTRREVVTGDSSTLGMTAEEALAVAIREALRKPREGETRARGVLTRVECGPANEAVFHVRAGDRTLKLDGGDLSGIHFTAFTPRETGSEIACGPRKLDNPVVVTYRAGDKDAGKLVAVEFVPAGFALDK